MYRVKLKHRCVDCGQVLTDDESIERGYGPVCWEKRNECSLTEAYKVLLEDYEPDIDIDIEQDSFFSKCGCESPYSDKICKEGHLAGDRWEVLIDGIVHEFCAECFEHIEETRSIDEPQD